MEGRLQQQDEVLGFVGAGRVGRALAVLCRKHGFTISSIIDVNLERARRVQRECSASISSTDLHEIDPGTTVLFITVPDDEIEGLGLPLAKSGVLEEGIVVSHTSGLYPSDVLSPIRGEGISICSFHPCFSFTEDFEDNLEGAFITLEGDVEGCRRLEVLARTLGGKPITLSKEDKMRYHVGCTMASNYLVSLMALVQRVLGEMDQGEGIQLVLPLVRETLRNIERGGVKNSLTGPILRGDLRTVESHLNVLGELDTTLIPPYIALGRVTLQIAETLGLESEMIHALKDLFGRYEREGK